MMFTRVLAAKPLVCVVMAAAVLSMGTAAAAATTSAEKAVLAPLQTLFVALEKRDRKLIVDQLLPGGMATLMREGKPLQLNFDDFATRLAQPGTTDRKEVIHDALVRIDDNIAIIWAPYVVTVDGNVDHCGTDIVHLVRIDNKWLIAGIADNSRKECTGK